MVISLPPAVETYPGFTDSIFQYSVRSRVSKKWKNSGEKGKRTAGGGKRVVGRPGGVNGTEKRIGSENGASKGVGGVLKIGRNRAREEIVVQLNIEKFIVVRERFRERSYEFIVAKEHSIELGQKVKIRGNRSVEEIGTGIEYRQIHEIRDGFGKRALEFIVGEVEEL